MFAKEVLVIHLLNRIKITVCGFILASILLINSFSFSYAKNLSKNIKPKITYNAKNTGKPIKNGIKNKKEKLSKKENKIVWKITSRFLREIDYEELKLLEQVVENEAGGEPYLGKIAVANVILNRCRSPLFPNTIRGVIFQKGQFAQLNRALKLTPSEKTKQAVKEALNGKQVISPDTFYFLNLNIAKDLTIPRTKTFVTRIGNHWFYK